MDVCRGPHVASLPLQGRLGMHVVPQPDPARDGVRLRERPLQPAWSAGPSWPEHI